MGQKVNDNVYICHQGREDNEKKQERREKRRGRKDEREERIREVGAYKNELKRQKFVKSSRKKSGP